MSKSEGIDPQTHHASATGAPFNDISFAQMRVIDAWQKYEGELNWGAGQCLAILDDGCDLSEPAWQVEGKVAATWNSIDNNDNCHPVPPGYHGTTVGYPSSIHLNGVRGLAWRNTVAHVRCATVVHLRQDESQSIAAGLRWVQDNAKRLNITAVNLSVLDDQQHTEPMPTVIDAELKALNRMNIWVSAPCGNHHYTDGISWPACQPHCVGVGATKPGEHAVHLDRQACTDLLVCAVATSSSNAYAAAGAQVLREAIDIFSYPWQDVAETLPNALLALFQHTGIAVHDDATGLDFKELDLLAALDHVREGKPLLR